MASQSFNQTAKWGITDDDATIPFYVRLSSDPMFCLRFILYCIVFAMPEDFGHTIWVFAISPWLGEHHELQYYNGLLIRHIVFTGLYHDASIVSHGKGWILASTSGVRSSSYKCKGRWIRGSLH